MPKGNKQYVLSGAVEESSNCPCGFKVSGTTLGSTKVAMRLHSRFCKKTELTKEQRKKNIDDRLSVDAKKSKTGMTIEYITNIDTIIPLLDAKKKK